MAGNLDRSTPSIFQSGANPLKMKRFQWTNRALASLNRSENWCNFTKWVFDRQWTTCIFDMLLDKYLANMSIRRNSTVIPRLTGKANVSYFCTGGIAWGLNKPNHMTCGMPFSLYEKLQWE